jgi:NADH:ubiquinone oxidoreductase subunit C
MLGLCFEGKTDSRNLLLEYTSVLKPLSKSFPSVGLFELFFDVLKQQILHRVNSTQL